MPSQRVVDSEVKAILPTAIDTQPFIETATLVVTERLSTMGYSHARLKEIERWLAAHFACLADPRVVRLDATGASATYEAGKVGEGLCSTRYGQQVQLLDYLGILTEDSTTTQVAIFRVD